MKVPGSKRVGMKEFLGDISIWRGWIPIHVLRSWGTYLLSRGDWFTKS